MKYLVLLLVLSGLLLQGWSGMARFVLCIAEDGRIAIEETFRGSCGSEDHEGNHDETPHPGAEEHRLARDGCGDCLDLPLRDVSSMGFLPSRTPIPDALLHSIRGVYLPARSFMDRWDGLSRNPYLHPPPDPSIRSLRTIILLI